MPLRSGDLVARLVSCPQCAAPYRVVGGETRFRCDYCRSLVEIREHPQVEELVITAPLPPESEVRRRLRIHLQQQGARGVRTDVDAGRYIPFWHLISRGGEELVVAAAEIHPPFASGFVLPAAPMETRDHPLCPEPIPPEVRTVEPEQAEAAALATFRDRDPTLSLRRLVWVPAVPITVSGRGWQEQGWFLPGPDRILLSALPEAARRIPVDRDRLIAYGVIAAIALSAGIAVGGIWPRLIVEIGVLAAAWLAWRMRFGRPVPPRAS